MDQLQNFEHSALEADMQRLAVEVKKHRENPEFSSVSEVELLKHSIQSLAGGGQNVPQPSGAAADTGVLPAYVQSAPAEVKLEVEYLIDMALHQGVEKATAEARKSKNPFIVDALHDALATKLYSELKKRSLI